MTLPNFSAVGAAYGLPSVRLDQQDFRESLRAAIEAPGPGLIEVMLDPEQGFEPRVSSRQLPDGTIRSPELEDMYPFLQPEELSAAMPGPAPSESTSALPCLADRSPNNPITRSSHPGVFMNYKQESERLFDGLFVLELANNHWGNVDRGLRIITDFSRIVRFNNVKASIKLQFRDVDRFVHRDFRERSDIRYIKKTLDTQMSVDDYKRLIDAVRASGCIPMSTPFDEESVRLCVRLGVEIIKIASSDLNDWVLIEEIAKTRKPVIVSTGGSSLRTSTTWRSSSAIGTSRSPSTIAYRSIRPEGTRNQSGRFPAGSLSGSRHRLLDPRKSDWTSSVMIAYAKGARTFERHIDIEADGIPVSPYCTLPDQADVWFKAYKKAVEMCGAPGTAKRIPPQRKLRLDGMVRGVYAKRDLTAGAELLPDDYYLAIPLQKGQMSCRELMNGERLLEPVTAHAPIRVTQIDSPYAQSAALRNHRAAGTLIDNGAARSLGTGIARMQPSNRTKCNRIWPLSGRLPMRRFG